MATRFTRVTIAAADRQVDVSLPSSGPLAEQIPMVLRLLSVASSPTPRRWVLSTPETGPLTRGRSLDESGILDGMVLFLTEAHDAPAAPFVDDVEQVAGEFAATLPPFSEEHRQSGVAGLLAVVLLAAAALASTGPSPLSWIGTSLAAIAALVIGVLVPGRGGALAAAGAVPAAALLVVVVDDPANGYFGPDGLLVLVAASLALVAVGLVRQASAATAAGITAVLFTLAGWIGLFADMPEYRMAALWVLMAVISTGLAGQIALGGAGLVNLLVADERGEKVPRVAVRQAVHRGAAIATGIVWASAGAAAIAVVVLMTTAGTGASAGWVPPVFGAVGVAVFALRSRMFSRVRQVAPMLLVSVIGLIAAAVTAPRWLSLSAAGGTALTLGLLAALAVLIAAVGFGSATEVPRARLRRLFEGLEFLAVLAVVPGLILVFNTVEAMRRWLG